MDTPAAGESRSEAAVLGSRILASHWPDLERALGERMAEFLATAEARAARHRIDSAFAVARFINLCCACGPGFEDKPRYEAALAILADERLSEWVRLHQAVLRCATELQRRAADGGQAGRQLLLADAALLDLLDRTARGARGDALPLARLACDLEAVDFRVLETDWRQEYRLLDGNWQRGPAPGPLAPVRMGLGHPAPARLCVLAPGDARAPAARLQVRAALHAQCGPDRHPLLSVAGSHGRWRWTGHEAKARSWPVRNGLQQPPGSPGLNARLLAETVAEPSVLQLTTCGVRDDGVPVGPVDTVVWAYLAEQWLFTLQREAVFEWDWPQAAAAGPRALPPASRCRLERDGLPVHATGWAAGFDSALAAGLQSGCDAVFAAWQQQVQQPAMQLRARLLDGHAGLSWGWREGAAGLAAEPLLRVVGALALHNAFALELLGELELGLATSRVRLATDGTAPLAAQLSHETETPDLATVLAAAAVRWRSGWRITHDPVAADSAVVVQSFGPCSGALVGEAGLRPRRGGGGGWEWYLQLDLEPVSTTACLADPVLGQSWRRVDLLPAQRLLDWSVG